MSYHSCVERIDYKVIPEKQSFYIGGWCVTDENVSIDYSFKIDGKEVPIKLFKQNREDVLSHLNISSTKKDIGFSIAVDSMSSISQGICLEAKSSSGRYKIAELNKNQLNRLSKKEPFVHSIDTISFHENEMIVSGWAFSLSDSPIEIIVKENESNSVINPNVQWAYRPDVAELYFLDSKKASCGFYFKCPIADDKKYSIYFIIGGKEYQIETKKSIKKIIPEIISNINIPNIKKGIHYIRSKGMKGLFRRLSTGNLHQMTYQEWYDIFKPSKEEFQRQREKEFKYTPKISLIVAAYNTPLDYFKEMVDSVLNQTYSNWELCIADGSDNDQLSKFVSRKYLDNSQIKYKRLNHNYGISVNMNEALELASGEYIGLFDHDDFLTPDALFEVVKVLQDKQFEFIYSDEDKYLTDKKELVEPHFKPDFNIDYLRSVNYICHFLVVKKQLIGTVGHFNKKYDGAQDYDFILRCIENLREEDICHIPQVLYHWRMHSLSTASNPESKLYAFKAGEKAIQDHLTRVGLKARVSMQPNLGLYRCQYELLSTPKISIIIPNKDHIDDLEKCIVSILKSNYPNYEIIVVENNSVENKTFDYYKQLSLRSEKIKVVYWESEFNYSAINNYGAKFATGEYLLLLNNDTEMIGQECLSEMLSYCQREDVGIVGAKLLYDDDTVQHGGVVVGLGGIAGHAFVGEERNAPGYFGRLICAQDLSAVTAACLMVKKSLFDEVGGLSEDLRVAFNDIDFCLKIRRLGYLVVYDPFAELYHYESKSRGTEDTPEKVQRFNNEILTFKKRWPDILENGDIYYNPNLTYSGKAFDLKER